MRKRKVVAVMPAYNEEKRIGGVLKRLRKRVDEILVSDDGSTDETAEIAKKAGARVISSPVNMGVGHATRLGCEYAVERMGADVLVLIDADGQHDPADVPKLLDKIRRGCGMVFTTRFGDSAQMPAIKRIGNLLLTRATGILSGANVSDSQSGFRAMSADSYKRFRLESDGYEICSEFVLETGRKNVKYCELPIKSIYDNWTRVKGTDVVSGFRIFSWMLLRRLFSWN